MDPRANNIGAFINAAMALLPQLSAAGTVSGTGTAIDRLGYDSAQLVVQTGAATGAPTSYTLDAKVQHSADGSTNWTDYNHPASGAAVKITTIAADDSIQSVNFNLSGAHRYLQVVGVLAIVGGSTPKVPFSAIIVRGGAQELPAS